MPMPKGFKHSKETKEKMSKAKKGNANSLGYVWTKEQKANLSEALKGNQFAKGHKHNEETRNRISDSHKGKLLSEETKNKISEGKIGENNPMYKGGRNALYEKQIKHRKDFCEMCGKADSDKKSFPVHHNPPIDWEKYEEWEGELITLCRSCHKIIHNQMGGTWIR